MDDYPHQLGLWIKKAKSDLATARIPIQGEETHLDSGVYHCQQAVEKALKGMLASQGQSIPRTHDLESLLSKCVVIDPALSTWEKAMALLSPYATVFRYPGELFEPSSEDAEEALRIASDKVELAVNWIIFFQPPTKVVDQ
jgi:HEPN domain-containing protein